MEEVSERIECLDVTKEVRLCPACGYGHGFHVSFLPAEEEGKLQLVLICPQCGARFELGNLV